MLIKCYDEIDRYCLRVIREVLTEKFIKAIAIILVLVMFSQLLPMSVIAEEVNSEDIIEFSEEELAGNPVI